MATGRVSGPGRRRGRRPRARRPPLAAPAEPARFLGRRRSLCQSPDRGRRLPRRSTLVLGGARSGKSRYAEALVEGAAGCGTYLATAEAGDAEMAARIAAHRARAGAASGARSRSRSSSPRRSARRPTPARPVLVDCLTLWLSNLMLRRARRRRRDRERCSRRCATPRGPVVLVANEVGLGIVPETPLGRAFRDAAGRLNQAVAALADRVVFVAAGLPLVLKGARADAPHSRHHRHRLPRRRQDEPGAPPARPPPPGTGSRSSSTSSATSASTASCCSAAATRPAPRTTSSSWPTAASAAPSPTISCRP